MKTKILTLLAASLLAPTIAAAEGGLSGDAKLACEAILCLSSGTRPGECTPSLNRYFSISHKYLSDTIRGRVSARTLCHHFAIILSVKHDKKNAKYGNNTIIQNPPLRRV